MPKVGPAPAFEVLEGGLAEHAESRGDFDRALTEVRAVSAGLDVCYGKGDVAETPLPPPPVHPGIAEHIAEPVVDPIETEVDTYLVGLDLPPPRARARRAAILLEQGRTVGEDLDVPQAERKA